MAAIDLALLGSLDAYLGSRRKSRELILNDLALVIRKSVGWLPQVERGLSEPSISNQLNLARAMDIPVSIPFIQANPAPEEASFVVRQGGR